MLTPIIYPYKMTSKSARSLIKNLHTKLVYPDRNYRQKDNHLVVNWGNSIYPTWIQRSSIDNPKFLNHPWDVSIAANKLATFEELSRNEINIPDFTTEKSVATYWINEGHKVYCRSYLTSHSGRGIVIASTHEELIDAPLYVKAVKKDKEYRVHVFNGEIIDFQLKKKKQGHEGGTPGIRNHSNGWIYARSEVNLPENVASSAILAVQALSLNFGAVDICTDRDGKAVVFEVNTAPGLFGTTLSKYTGAIRRLL